MRKQRLIKIQSACATAWPHDYNSSSIDTWVTFYICCIVNICMSHFAWTWRCLKSPATQLFVQSLSRLTLKRNQSSESLAVSKGRSSVTSRFPSQRASDKKSISMSWHYDNENLLPWLDGLVQERRNSSALAMELCLSCINPSMWSYRLCGTWYQKINYYHCCDIMVYNAIQ